MKKINVPAAWVSSHEPTPLRICTRHGEPAEETHNVQFHVKLPAWMWLPLVAGALLVGMGAKWLGLMISPLVIIIYSLANRAWPPMHVAGWPYCARCRTLHRGYLVGVAVIVLGIIPAILAVFRAMRGTADLVTLALLACGVFTLIAGIVLRESFSWRRLGGAKVSRDRLSLHVKAHERFAADIRERLTAQRVPAAPQSLP